jgi:hypothetical protein
MGNTFKNKTETRIRLNSICPYFTMFPLDFPYNALSNAKSNEVVFDPFCGRGTTNFASRLRGLRNYGIDSNPVAQAIAESKLVSVSPASVLKLAESILSASQLPNDVPNSQFWRLAYHEQTLIEILTLRKYFQEKKKFSKTDIALRAIILGILHGPTMKTQPSYLSNQMPRTFATKPDYSVKYWTNRKLNPQYVNTLELIKRRAQYIYNKDLPKPVEGKIILGDSRQQTIEQIDEKISWIVTSPPYFGMSTYEQDQWLRNWFLGGPDLVKYGTEGQIKHSSLNAFVSDLSTVWKNISDSCNEGAKMIIRFGALPSIAHVSPSEILKDSLKRADVGWTVSTIRKIVDPSEAKRQANQFKNSPGKYVEEIDLYASLKP